MLPDLVQNDNLEEFLLSNECPLLGNILTELQQFNPTKWNDIPLSFLYPQLLTDVQELMKTCIVKELTVTFIEHFIHFLHLGLCLKNPCPYFQ